MKQVTIYGIFKSAMYHTYNTIFHCFAFGKGELKPAVEALKKMINDEKKTDDIYTLSEVFSDLEPG
eukprot:5793760-Pleurochrysis_carterae.AAC.1